MLNSPIFWPFSNLLLIYCSIIGVFLALGSMFAGVTIHKAQKTKRALKRIDLISYSMSIVGFAGVIGPLLVYMGEVSTIKQRFVSAQTLIEAVKKSYGEIFDACDGPPSRPEVCTYLRDLERQMDPSLLEGRPLKLYDRSAGPISDELTAKLGSRLN